MQSANIVKGDKKQLSDKQAAFNTVDSEIETLQKLKTGLDYQALSKALDLMQFSLNL